MQAKFNLLLLRNSKKPLSIRMNFLIYCVRQRKYADSFLHEASDSVREACAGIRDRS